MKIPQEMQDDLLNRCLKSQENMTMAEGLELVREILVEINEYLLNSPVSKAVATQLATRNKNSAVLTIPVDLSIFVDQQTKEATPPRKKPKSSAKKSPPKKKKSDLDMIIEEASTKGIDIKGVDKTVQAIRDHIDLVEGFVLDEEPEIPIITTKSRKKKVRITPSIGSDQKPPSRLSKLAAMASTKDLTDIENFCTSKFDLEK